MGVLEGTYTSKHPRVLVFQGQISFFLRVLQGHADVPSVPARPVARSRDTLLLVMWRGLNEGLFTKGQEAKRECLSQALITRRNLSTKESKGRSNPGRRRKRRKRGWGVGGL